DLGEPFFGLLARPFRRTEIDLQEVRVGAAGQHVEAALLQAGRERVGVRADLALVFAELLRRGDLEAGRLRGDRVLERPALEAGEDRTVEFLRVLLAAEDEAAARARERLVRRRRDEVAVRYGVRVKAGGDEPGEMGHVAEQVGADLVRDLAEAVS